MKVIVASENPVKLAATKMAFEKMFPEVTFEFLTSKSESGVPDQPMSDEETLCGAMNRIEHVKGIFPEADYWVGLEGGAEDKGEELELFAWMVVRSKDGRLGKGRAATFFVPKAMADLVRGGMELGHAADQVFNESNLKQRQGTIGVLTNDLVTRRDYYEQPLIIALVPFRHPDQYPLGERQI